MIQSYLNCKGYFSFSFNRCNLLSRYIKMNKTTLTTTFCIQYTIYIQILIAKNHKWPNYLVHVAFNKTHVLLCITSIADPKNVTHKGLFILSLSILWKSAKTFFSIEFQFNIFFYLYHHHHHHRLIIIIIIIISFFSIQKTIWFVFYPFLLGRICKFTMSLYALNTENTKNFF